MRLLTILFSCIILFQINVFAELTAGSCDLLRTGSSLTTIIPEIAQLAMRYYRASSSSPSAQHRRQKRFLPTGTFTGAKGSVAEQMIANAVRDVNFTNVAILIFGNNETMNKVRKNVDTDVVVRKIMREVDYEKLISGLWSAAEKEFDLEHFIDSVITKSRLDIIHDELFQNGTLPLWLIKSIHPDLQVQTVERILSTLRNVTHQFVEVLSKSERFDNYLFNMITQQAITPLNSIIQGVKDDKPKTFNQLIDIIVNNVNRVAMGQVEKSTKQTTTKKPGKKLNTTTIAPVDLNNGDDVKLMLYQWSIAVNSMGQTSGIILKSLEHLYCTPSSD